jgi:hypothetical protein
MNKIRINSISFTKIRRYIENLHAIKIFIKKCEYMFFFITQISNMDEIRYKFD